MTIAPAVTLMWVNAILAVVASAILRHRWQKYFALGCACVHVVGVVFLIVLVAA